MASINMLNPKAETARSSQALAVNISAARGLQDVLASNLGPRGTMKMLVSGAGDIKITKDGCTLLGEMQIQHPTASLIARVATSQDEITGDGTTSIVLLVGEILRQAGLLASDGVHPRMLTEGIEIAKNVAIKELENIKFGFDTIDRDVLMQVARSTLGTKLQPDVAELLTGIVVDAVLNIMENTKSNEIKDLNAENKESKEIKNDVPSQLDSDIDLYMVEIMEMVHQLDLDTKLVRGLVLDHGGRHPDMPNFLENCYILTCNVSFEYDKSEINSGFFYNTTQDREKMVKAERVFTDNKVKKVIELKRQVCTEENKKTFVVINQKGIDPISLEMLAKEGILALRRAKRRNMERLVKCCGGEAMNSVEELTPECLGYAGKVYQKKLNDDNYTFVEDTPKSQSVTVLIKGPNKHTVVQIKDAVRDGLRAVKNTIDSEKNTLKNLLPGAGAVEVYLHNKLMEYKQNTPMLKQQYGVQALAQALLIIPRTLAKNAGLDQQDILANLQNQYIQTKIPVGINLQNGEAIDPKSIGIYDNFETKKHMITSCTTIAGNLLLVDEIMRAGLSSLKEKPS